MKEELTRRLDSLMDSNRDDNVLPKMMETKLQLNWKINKDEIY